MPSQNYFAGFQVEQNAIKNLSHKRIFFGHMSVGYDVLNGFEELKAHDSRLNEIRLIRIETPSEVAGPGIYHASIGWNGLPKNKIDAFKNTLNENRLGEKLDIAFFKFCYVDFNRESDPKGILNYYVATIDALKKDFPNLKFIHVTVPLYVHSQGLRSLVRNIVKGDLDNIKRNEYNKLLLEKYGMMDPVFDLAKVESESPDGARSGFDHHGQFYSSLFKGFTIDGGHLNSQGRLAAAKELLVTLCRL